MVAVSRPTVASAIVMLSLLIAGPLVPLAQETEATSHDVHPGDQMSAGSSFCTVNFVFDGQGAQAGDVYFGTAAHCVSGVGQSITIGGTSGFAQVAYVHPGSELVDDFAFLRVAPQHESRVQADVHGHTGTPTGTATPAETNIGDLIHFSGYGVGFSFTPITREIRSGVLFNHAGGTYVAEGPITPGDSGGPVLHESGEALGIVSALVAGCCTGPGAWIEGPSVHNMVDAATDNGFHVQLRTA